MFLTIQFPISDLRYFSQQDTGKLSKPSWPIPISRQVFIRNFGAVIERNLGGLSGWIGESYICKANQAIKFKELHHPFNIGNKRIKIKHIFRRFYFDGFTTGKFEIGLSITIEEKTTFGFEKSFVFSKEIISAVIEHILALPVCVPVNGCEKDKEIDLIKIGSKLSELYLSSTTRNGFPIKNIKDWWVKACDTILYLETHAHEEAEIPYHCRNEIEKPEFGRLCNFRIKYQGCDYPLWVMHPYSNYSRKEILEQKQFLRKVRILVLRVHAEKENLLNVLDNIRETKKNIDISLDLLEEFQSYLNEATRRILAIESQSKKIFDTGDASFLTNTNELVDSNFSSQILHQIKGLSKNISLKIKNFIELNKVVNKITVLYLIDGEEQEKIIDVDHLVHELIQLRAELRNTPADPRKEKVIGYLTAAEKEAKKGNSDTLLAFLSKAGKMAYDIAVNVGASLASELIKQAILG